MDDHPERDPAAGHPTGERWNPGEPWHPGEPWPHDEPWTHRPHDHLVEPMFSGLGVRAEPPSGAPGAESPDREASTAPTWLALCGVAAILIWWLLS